MKKTNDVSKLVGVTRRTLQYYDDVGILLTERSEQNYRLYDQQALETLWEILIYKEMGFQLREIKQLLPAPNEQQRDYLRLHMRKIRRQVEKLEDQLSFISFVLKNGIPRAPEEQEGRTYAASLADLKKSVRENAAGTIEVSPSEIQNQI